MGALETCNYRLLSLQLVFCFGFFFVCLYGTALVEASLLCRLLHVPAAVFPVETQLMLGVCSPSAAAFLAPPPPPSSEFRTLSQLPRCEDVC